MKIIMTILESLKNAFNEKYVPSFTPTSEQNSFKSLSPNKVVNIFSSPTAQCITRGTFIIKNSIGETIKKVTFENQSEHVFISNSDIEDIDIGIYTLLLTKGSVILQKSVLLKFM